MRAYRHRLIFWPLFCGTVVFSLSGKGAYGPFWPIVYAVVAAVVVYAALYSSDPMRYRSGTVRRVFVLASLLAAIACLVLTEAAGCGITILFFLAVFAVPLAKAEKRTRHARNP